MIPTDIILVVILVIFVAFVLNLNIVNAKKIRRNQAEAKLKEIQEATKVSKETSAPKNDGSNENYMHDMANLKPFTMEDLKLEMQEVDGNEIQKPTMAVGQTKKFSDTIIPDEEFNHAGYIVNELDEDMNSEEEFEEDYDIGVEEDEDDVQFKSALSDEFKTLSPAMRAFIMANIMKNNHNNTNHNDDDDRL